MIRSLCARGAGRAVRRPGLPYSRAGVRRARVMLAVAALTIGSAGPPAATARADYPGSVLSTPGLQSYWRLGEASGTFAADAAGGAAGTYVGGVGLGAHGALSSGADTAARFDGVNDELQAGVAPLTGAGTLEGWFFWEGGVAVMRDATSAGGWILAFDSGGHVAYRAGGTTFTTALATADVRDGWHHLALTVSGGSTAFYVDGALVHSGTGAGPAAAAMPWHVMRNGTTAGQYTRGRADEGAVYAVALSAATVRSQFAAGRDVTDTVAPATPTGLKATAGLGRVTLDWADVADADLDGYDVFRATNAAGPFTRVNASRLSGSAYT